MLVQQYYYEDLYGRNTVNANMWIQEMRRKLDDKFGETCNTFRDAFNAFAKTIE